MGNKVNNAIPDGATCIALLVEVGFQVSPDHHRGYDWLQRDKCMSSSTPN